MDSQLYQPFLAIDIDMSKLIVMIALIIMSAFFSASETAFSSVSRIKLVSYAEEGRRGAKKALKLADNYDRTLSTVLVGNNIVNVILPTVSFLFFQELLKDNGWSPEFVSTVIITMVLLVFGEVMPKSLAKSYSVRICLSFATLLSFISILLWPLSFIFVKLQRFLLRNKEDEVTVTESEFDHIVNTMNHEGVLDEDERDLIQSVLELNDTKVKDIMTPRTDLFAIDINNTDDIIKEMVKESKFSRIPIYKTNTDDIIGILHQKDYFIKIVNGEEVILRDIVRRAHFVNKTMRIDELIEEMQKQKVHLAIVSDENGGTAGIVTLEDALEELVGEIYDESDDAEVSLIMEVGENHYLVDASVDIEEFFEELDLGNPPDTEYSNIRGWLYEKLKKIPEEKDKFKYESKSIITKDSRIVEMSAQITFTLNEVRDRQIKNVYANIIRVYDYME